MMSALPFVNVDEGALQTYSAMTAMPWWFLRCLFVYYIAYWICCRIMGRRMKVAIVVSLFVVLARWMFVCWFQGIAETAVIYHKLVHYMFFPMMLLGGCLANNSRGGRHLIVDAVFAFACLAGYVATHYAAMRCSEWPWLFIVSICFLFGFCHYAYWLSQSQFVARLMEIKVVVRLVGGLSLEIYISHFCIVTSKLNGIFPFNLLVVFAGMVALAYIVHVFGRFIGQTLSGQYGYDWRKMFSVW